MQWLIRLFIIGVALYLVALLTLYLQQRKILFHPSHTAPTDEGFALGVGDEKIWVEVRNPGSAKALIYFPGNEESYWESPDDLAKNFPGYTLYFPHYRGYGASSGSPSESAFFSDALRIYDHIRKQHNFIAVIGRSLGSGVAVWLASKRPVSALILTTPYDSIRRLGQENYPLFPVSWIIKDPFESWEYAGKIGVPPLILLAGNDQVIPRHCSEALIAAFHETHPLVKTFPHADHGNIIDDPEYYPTIREFLKNTQQTSNLRPPTRNLPSVPHIRQRQGKKYFNTRCHQKTVGFA